jgi:protein SCO1/2
MQRKRIAEATKGIGKPKVGGPFELIDQNGDAFTSEDMKGRYALVCCVPEGFRDLSTSSPFS